MSAAVATAPPVNAATTHPPTTTTSASSTGGPVTSLDSQIERLKRCEYLRENEVKALCLRAREILVDEGNVQRVDAPVTVSWTQERETWWWTEIWRVFIEYIHTAFLIAPLVICYCWSHLLTLSFSLLPKSSDMHSYFMHKITTKTWYHYFFSTPIQQQ